MKKLTRDDILTNDQYLTERDDRRKKIIAMKKLRRVDVGDKLSFTFENRETVKYQIQEMMRVERITDETKIQFEIDVYNELIPDSGTLSATMFIEIPDTEKIKPTLDTLQGLDQKGIVVMEINGEKSHAQFEPGHSNENRIAAVHYVQFPLSENQVRNFETSDVRIEIRHPAYMTKAFLTAEQKSEIAKDLKPQRHEEITNK